MRQPERSRLPNFSQARQMKTHRKTATEALIEPEPIDKEELRRRLDLPSIRMLEELMRKRKIPFIRLGHRNVRFSWPKVLAALSAFEYRAVGM
jgi:arsenate reductase-like glutaredoxin family protein